MKIHRVKILATLLFISLSVLVTTANTGCYYPKTREEGNVVKRFNFSATNTPDLESVDKALVAKHFLGQEVAVLSYIVRKTYVTKKTDYSGTSTETTIEKPAIYNAILKMNKKFIKAVKKGEYTTQEAAEIFSDCLEKSYSLFFVETKELENLMTEMEDLEQYIALYNCISFK